MPFIILGFENIQGTKDSSSLECVGVAENLLENFKIMRSCPMTHELIEDLNILITRQPLLIILKRGVTCNLITHIRLSHNTILIDNGTLGTGSFGISSSSSW